MRDRILSRINFCIFILHPVRCKLRLHYARLYAGGIVDLQSKFVLIPQLELTRAVAQTVPDFFLTLPFVGGCHPRLRLSPFLTPRFSVDNTRLVRPTRCDLCHTTRDQPLLVLSKPPAFLAPRFSVDNTRLARPTRCDLCHTTRDQPLLVLSKPPAFLANR